MTLAESNPDVIVIGAGSAGAVVAARLSEDPSCNVLLLEAGMNFSSAETPWNIRSPNPAHIISDPNYHWPGLVARRTTVQDPSLYWRGRGVGGSSTINGQIAIQAMLEDYDTWNLKGWSGADLTPAIARMETDLDFGVEDFHGDSGPIPIYRTPQKEWGAVDIALRDAAFSLGHVWHPDHNAPGSSGVSTYAINSRDGQRVSTNDAYLEPARGRSNLTIRDKALVDRVIIKNGRVTGVQAIVDQSYSVFTANEVILCAGVMHSPAILQRSGIGPSSLLTSLELDIVADLPVGHGLQDHPTIWLMLDLKEEARATSPDTRHTNCCVRYGSGAANNVANDTLILSMNLSGYSDEGFETGIIELCVMESDSRGRVQITTRDSRVDPQVDFHMLSDYRDLDRLRAGARHLMELSDTDAVRSIATGSRLGPVALEIDPDWPDEKLDPWLMQTCLDAQHASGTCRMGKPDDSSTVVDTSCRVLGIDGLRVIDTSIMPKIPRANTHLPTVTIAEHAAALITTE